MERIFISMTVLFGILLFGISSMAEEITLTTYYPAPYGAYEELSTTGNVGIGTTNPAGRLEVYDSGRSVIIGALGTESGIAANEGTNDWLTLRGKGTGGVVFNYADGSGGIWLYDGGSSTIYAKLLPTGDSYINAGDFGIGTTDPSATLHVNGNIKAVLDILPGGSGKEMKYNTGTNVVGYNNDLAELFETTEAVEVGDVLVIDKTEDIRLRKSSTPYEKGVAGIASGSPAILFEGSSLEIAPRPGGFESGTKPPVALAGRVLCKVSLENGPIERGDLLTTSSVPGHAMKATDWERSFGAILGKALEPFSSGPDGEETGKIVVLVTLQ